MPDDPKEPKEQSFFDDSDERTLHELAVRYRFRKRLKAIAWTYMKWIAAVGASIAVFRDWLLDFVRGGGS